MRPVRQALVSLVFVGLAGCTGIKDMMPFGQATGATPQTATVTTPGLAIDRKPGYPPYAMMKGTMLIAPHGAKRTDYYYWLGEKNTEKVVRYLEEENRYAGEAMARTADLQAALLVELRSRLGSRPGAPPFRDGSYWYSERYAPGADYPVVERRKGSPTGPAEIMLDGEQEGARQNQYVLGHYTATGDGAIFAWTADHEGDRWFTLTMKDTRTGGSQSIKHVAPSFAVAGDNRTLFYLKLEPGTGRAFRLMRHAIATDPATDKVVYEEKDARFQLSLTRSTDGRFIFLNSRQATTSEVLFIEAAKPDARWARIRPRAEGVTYEVDAAGGQFLVVTNLDAPDRRIMTAPVAQPATWTERVPTQRGAYIAAFRPVGGRIALQVWAAGISRIRLHDPATGTATDLAGGEPGIHVTLADAKLFPGMRQPDPGASILRYGRTGPATPDTITDVDVVAGTKKDILRHAVPGFVPGAYEVTMASVPTADGREVPMTMAWRGDRMERGKAPALLIGYGAYGQSNPPVFDPALVSLMDRGFVVAWAHTRGGRERGEAWYADGRLRAKQNSFNDFVAAAEHLARTGIADRARLFAMGQGAGGLLVGAVANTRPDLFKGIVARAPGADLLSRMLDDQLPRTTFDYDEWGNPAEPGDYAFIQSYSPYDQVDRRAYPAMLVTASYNDTDVGYYGPAKWVAKIRRLKTDQNRLIFRVNMTAGHEGETGRMSAAGEAAFIAAFLLDEAGLNKPAAPQTN